MGEQTPSFPNNMFRTQQRNHLEGLGVHPDTDPWGRRFSADFHADRWTIAGTPIAGRWTFCLDGVQGDADFVAAMFSLNRFITTSIFSKFSFATSASTPYGGKKLLGNARMSFFKL